MIFFCGWFAGTCGSTMSRAAGSMIPSALDAPASSMNFFEATPELM